MPGRWTLAAAVLCAAAPVSQLVTSMPFNYEIPVTQTGIGRTERVFIILAWNFTPTQEPSGLPRDARRPRKASPIRFHFPRIWGSLVLETTFVGTAALPVLSMIGFPWFRSVHRGAVSFKGPFLHVDHERSIVPVDSRHVDQRVEPAFSLEKPSLHRPCHDVWPPEQRLRS